MVAIVDRDTNIRGVWIADAETGLPLLMGSGANAQNFQGAYPNLSTSSANPMVVAGRYTTSPPTLTTGQLSEVQLGLRGQFYTTIMNAGGTGFADVSSNGADGASNNDDGLLTYSRVAIYNAAGTWDRMRGDTNGLFTQPGTLPAGTDRSGSATTSSTQTIASNAARRGLNIQNIGTNNIGVNEFGGTAAIGTAGTYTLTPGSSMNIRTNRAITMIAATGATAFTATEF